MTSKTLILMRHAKSSWKNPDLPDHERALNRRGHKAAQRMGQLFSDRGLEFGAIYCSSAIRARETATLAFARTKAVPTISFRDELYHATADQMIALLREVPEPTNRVLLIGHNPGLDEFLLQLIDRELHIPTGSVAELKLSIEQWDQFDATTRGNLIHFWRPRELKGS